MDNSRILVTGFPVGTTKQQLTIYFQSERDSGGGDVDSIEIDRGKAYITFEEVEGITFLWFYVALYRYLYHTRFVI